MRKSKLLGSIAISIVFLFVTVFTSLLAYNKAKEKGHFKLPASLRIINNEAFVGTAAEKISLPESTTVIGARAFADNSVLSAVYMQASVVSIGEDVFRDTAFDLVVFGENGSYAQEWADKHGIRFVICSNIYICSTTHYFDVEIGFIIFLLWIIFSIRVLVALLGRKRLQSLMYYRQRNIDLIAYYGFP